MDVMFQWAVQPNPCSSVSTHKKAIYEFPKHHEFIVHENQYAKCITCMTKPRLLCDSDKNPSNFNRKAYIFFSKSKSSTSLDRELNNLVIENSNFIYSYGQQSKQKR